MKKKIEVLILIFLIFLLILVNYNSLDKALTNFLKNSQTATVARVIDGDTIILNSGERVRLLGINSPEITHKEKYSLEAKRYLKNLVENKTVKLEEEGTDRYGRTLAYIFFENKNINKIMIENGLANLYFPKGKGPHYDEFVTAWKECLQSNKNICEKSTDVCANCIKLEKLDPDSQEVIFHNQCTFVCNITEWQIKDEGRKEFYFPEFILYGLRDVTIKTGNGTNTKSTLYWSNYNYVWTKAGDTLFLRDNEGKLVLWKNY